jgi:O-acetyl-ADP-ribose deacetylase
MDQPAPPATERVSVVTADITTLRVDAIVNAANESLLGGGGVDGAIHRAAGPELLRECRSLGGCPTGVAKITRGFNLPAQWVIHAVGPVWSGDPKVKLGKCREDVLLASCYDSSLALAKEHEIQTIAFPAISTGAYRFPKDRAAKIAVSHVLTWLGSNDLPARVIFCCFSPEDAAQYQHVIATRGKWWASRK